MDERLRHQWTASRSGARSGRGYHFQDAVGALDACLAWIERAPLVITPEGWEDYSVESPVRPAVHRQVKSRQRHLGSFSLGKVAGFINKGWAAHAMRLSSQPGAEFELVLESGVSGFPELPSGFLGGTDLGEALRPLLRVDQVSTENMLALTSLRVEPEPVRRAVDALSAALGTVPTACVPIFQAVRSHVGEAADANASRSSEDRERIGLTDVDRLIAGVREMTHADRLEEALDRGLVEPIDWGSQVHDERFYEGVHVVPGHVAAGLVVDRPALAESINVALDESGFALVAGPSGSGKSALAWLVANRRRGMPCYRLRRLDEGDVEAAIRFVRALLPTRECPVTFVVDDLGRADMGGFDRFAREVGSIPGVAILATVRNENLLLVREAHKATIFRPSLDEELAERLFTELSRRSATPWPHWREPLEESRGLLLEYTHILTRGERLAVTIQEQVDDRVRENRATELHILALVATASASGANVPWEAIERVVGAGDAESTLALRRLMDEHLITKTPEGVLTGLHQLRSSAAEAAIHRSPPRTRSRTLRELVSALPGPELLPLLASVALDDEKVVVIGALADRLVAETDVEVLIAGLQGLRLAGFSAEAATWVEVSVRHRVPPGLAPLVFSMALAESDLSGLPLDERVAAAVADIVAMPSPADPRAALLEGVGPDRVATLLAQDLEPDIGAALLDVLSGMAIATCSNWPPTSFLSEAIASAPLPLLARIQDSMTRIDRDAAIGATSGDVEEEILARIAQETAWLRELSILDTEESTIASCVWLNAIDPPDQSVHDLVVDVARTICWCLPRVDEVHIRAVFPDGEDAGVGDFSVASKRLNRRVLISDDEVRWNRVRLTAAASLVSVPSASERLSSEASLLDEAAEIAAQFGQVWLTGKGSLRPLDRRRQELAERAHMLGPAPTTGLQMFRDAGTDTDTQVDSPIVDGVGDSTAVNLAKFIMPGLSSAKNLQATAAVIGRQLKRLDEALDPEYWDLIGLSEPPPGVPHLRRSLDDLQAIALGLANGDVTREEVQKAGRAGSANAAIARAAKLARSRCRRRFDTQLAKFLTALESCSASVTVIEAPGDPAAPWWPAAEIGLLVQVEDLLDWFAAFETIVSEVPDDLGQRGVSIAPIRDNRVVEALAGRLISGKWFESSDALDCIRSPETPPAASTPTADAFSRASSSLITISALVAWDTPDHTHPDEQTALDDAQDSYSEAVALLQGLDPDDPVIQEAIGVLVHLSERVQDEIDNHVDRDRTLAAEISRVIRGSDAEESESLNGIRGANVFLQEWDIDRANARQLLERFA
ncbi:hypothetical protein BMS3Bbin01_00256 [bacterium BMS3Bbin01]|nr:hypothetical protein BMS3Bbin01_00256 [bacterium BMS3Bbin01]